MSEVSDFDLLGRWRDGDADAGNELVRRHVEAVYRFFANKVNEGLEDLAQQTWTACVQARDRIDPDRSFPAYLMGIARNKLLHHYREQAKVPREFDAQNTSIADYQDSPSRVVADRQERRVLLEGLRRLPIDYQVALELFYWERMGVQEISVVLGAPQGTVKSRLARGRTMLRDIVENMVEDAELLASTARGLEDWARSLRRHATPKS